jgi:hypothetical protein
MMSAAKANAKKSQKSALGKAKKAEKALADANKEHAQREQAVAERLRTMSTATEGKCFALSSISTFVALLYLLTLFFPFLSYLLLLRRIYRGIFVVPATGR